MAAPNSITKNAETPRREAESRSQMQPFEDVTQYLREYARSQPEMAALWCLGVGFVLGWKLKPW